MVDTRVLQTGERTAALLQSQTGPPHRILLVEDDDDILHLNAEVLARSGYHVDTAEDGAVAWDTLQRARYDLVVTDNNMPKVSGVELIERIHAAGIALPVIMATGMLPDEFTRRPWPRPEAILIKPYSFHELLGTVQKVLQMAVLMAMLTICLPAAINAQSPLQPPTGLRIVASSSTPQANATAFLAAGNGAVNVQVAASAPPLPAQSPDSPDQPTAMTISTVGKCECSEDGVTFTNLAKGQILEHGVVLRTGEGARADLFFRRTGTTVRLQPGSELRIENMTLTIKDGLPLVNTLLDLRKGRIFTVVRSAVVGSTLEIRNAAGRSVVEGSGIGRYIITADGTHVAAKGSVIPLKVIGENGVTVLAAGQQFDKKDGKPFAASPTFWVKDMIELDELQAVSEEPVAKAPSLIP
jgi:DNA-binding response OmpR family regulator